ncbi:DUF6365 family protein [Rhizohabitans arisaemae]|uniref:DUF6365 family protein n=1 Tax=Rhizohabitans arisaemae TaxID=2720610 RepID=UPI0024B06583|nr:DUF6365 family protein [Rhizohabitans arisaemae]
MKLLFLGLGHLSKGDVSIAADFARQLPRNRFQVGFVATPDAVPQLRDLGLATLPLDAGTPEANLATFDTIMRNFRPDCLVAADPFTLNYSASWSGLSVGLLRERYGDLPLAGFDQYDWRAADYCIDFYGGYRKRFPRLLEECDLLIRNCPLNRPAASEANVAVTPMIGGGLRGAAPVRPAPGGDRTGRPTVFLVNSAWEYVNVVNSPEMDQLIHAMPRIVHSHLAALGRPLQVVHVGPRAWDFPIDERIEYRHLIKLPPASFHERLTGADLFITANAASVTLTQAALAGVPTLLLQNDKVYHRHAVGAPAWLDAAVPTLTTMTPFRVFPWGWYDLLTPVLSNNPYTGCFRTAGVLQRRKVLDEMTTLLDDMSARTELYERQLDYRERLGRLASPADSFLAVARAL